VYKQTKLLRKPGEPDLPRQQKGEVRMNLARWSPPAVPRCSGAISKYEVAIVAEVKGSRETSGRNKWSFSQANYPYLRGLYGDVSPLWPCPAAHEGPQHVAVRFDARDDSSRRLAERLRAADRREAAS
jgi:hypothetical protein